MCNSRRLEWQRLKWARASVDAARVINASLPRFEMPDELPLLPLREYVVFPYMVLPLFVGREASVAAVEDALAADRLVLLVAQRDSDIDEPGAEDLHRIGTVAMVMRTMRLPDGRVKALVQGLAKASIEGFVEDDPALRARVRAVEADAEPEWNVEAEALMRAVRSRVEELLPLKHLPPEVLTVIAAVNEPGRLADLIASHLRLRLAEAQEVLETRDPIARLRRVDVFLRRELEVTAMQAEIQSQAKEEMSRGQREHFLREQLRAIQAELGEGESRGGEADDYRQKLDDAGLPEEPLAEALRQARRPERMHPDGPEAQVVRGYLDWICDLPWSAASPDELDLANARAILDRDHTHPKASDLFSSISRCASCDRIRAVRSATVGPPGVGKTSLGRSIARAMGELCALARRHA